MKKLPPFLDKNKNGVIDAKETGKKAKKKAKKKGK
jgi:hypothetical protein